ncbi:formylglycine-generating enzyme family protein [Nodularia harveyana UHCC-0300]|uniref:Formylglycine-generating enzyme family protein n=1 Tax=Nodularia harveyana UHCC-0300 TaxID=2974287 RepID=A0ABU5UH70_9CYAN|nr:formylglycine-generating enzyme family protein [Nodularia harveyana]MEA5582908.1 formylglycine-generating enzyme family protein [Nodularia harveyana UHCC-0300]
MSAPPEKENPKLAEAEINLTAQQLADIIWLMVQIKPSLDTAEVEPLPNQGNSSIISLPPKSEIIDSTQIAEPIVNTASVYADTPANYRSESASAGLPLKITDPLALRNNLALGRSLRPLMRKVPSLTETVLDEEATINSIAEEDFWLPIFQPVSTRWLEVALVIEETARYPLWRQIITEFQQLLERHGAFRNVSLWHIKMGNEGEVQLYLKHRQASLKELNDPSGRRLIWLVSDCVSPIWHDGSLLKVLRDWAKMQPVSLLQLLPERLWLRTALGWGMEVQLYSENPGVPNPRLLKTRPPVDKDFNSPQALTLPIITLESFPMKNWAKVLAGVGGSRTPGLVFLPEKITSEATVNDDEDNQLSAKARVSRFQAAASPLSRQLARMMAAVPVSLPVIRLIQQTLLPDSHAVHLAEVLMGGLLKPTAEQPRNQVNEEVNYEFYPGVRAELIKITRKSQTIDVILCLSEFINRQLQLRQSVRNFDAMLFNPDVEVDPDYLPFARITAETLQLLGGEYADMGEQIQHKISHTSEALALSTEKFETVTVNRSGEIIKQETKTAQYFTESLPSNVTLEMVSIPGDKFLMGSPKDEAESSDRERPQHEVTVSPFFMGKYPITQAQWRAVAALPQVNRELKPDPSKFKGEQRPVERVSWYDAVEFCQRLTAHTKKQYSLPSEAEWEYACRAGTTSPFHFGETITSELANYDATSIYGKGVKGTYREETTPVGSFKVANNFGLYDMHGNVWEWCLDDWHDNYEGAPTDGSAWFNDNDNLSQKQGSAVLRGGSWFNNPTICRSASRLNYLRAGRDFIIDFLGFRVVCAVGRIL